MENRTNSRQVFRKGEQVSDKQFEQCMKRIQRGDKTALKEIYEAYLPLVYTIAVDVLKNKENAEDITSEFFIKLWEIADRFKEGNGHKAWMIRIIKNMAIDYIRKYRKEEMTDFSDASKEEKAKDQVEEEVIGNLSLQKALSTLSEGEQEIVKLKVLADMTFKEIAKTCNQPMGTVTWKYQNAMKKLRRCGYE